MIDLYANLRAAIDAGPTPGRWNSFSDSVHAADVLSRFPGADMRPSSRRPLQALPLPGAFLRPIGIHRFRYAMRVVQVFEARYSGHPGIEYERWGISDDGLPIDDGHVSGGCYIDLVPSLIRGVYRDPPMYPQPGEDDGFSYRWARPEVHRWPTYYRLIGCDERGQMGLFA